MTNLNELAGDSKSWKRALPLLALAALYCAWAIVSYPFPDCVPFIFWPALAAVTWYDIRWGIGAWYVGSVLGNMVVLDLPGIPPLRPTHLVLLLMLAVWIVKTHHYIPAGVVGFISTAKNKVLILLLAWAGMSMLMGRITGVTQRSAEYQFNAWFSMALAVILAVIVMNHAGRQLVGTVISLTVILGLTVTLIVLYTGFLDGLPLMGWKEHYFALLKMSDLVLVVPLYPAIAFFGDQPSWSKPLFGATIVLSSALGVLMVLSGSRRDLLPLATMAFMAAFAYPRVSAALAVLVAVPVIAVNLASLGSWVGEQVEYSVTYQGVAQGAGARIGLWLDALETIKQYPLWGTGSDSYRLHANIKVVGHDEYYRTQVKWATDAHNTWLQTAVDHGIPGAALLAAFYGLVLKDAVALHRSIQDPFYRKFVLVFLATFCTTVLASAFGDCVLPVLSAKVGAEETQLAPYLVGFWLNYGLFVGIERHHCGQSITAGVG